MFTYSISMKRIMTLLCNYLYLFIQWNLFLINLLILFLTDKFFCNSERVMMEMVENESLLYLRIFLINCLLLDSMFESKKLMASVIFPHSNSCFSSHSPRPLFLVAGSPVMSEWKREHFPFSLVLVVVQYL